MFESMSAKGRLALLDALVASDSCQKSSHDHNLGRIARSFMSDEEVVKDYFLDFVSDLIVDRFDSVHEPLCSAEVAVMLSGRNNVRNARMGHGSSAFASLALGENLIQSWYFECFDQADKQYDEILSQARARQSEEEA